MDEQDRQAQREQFRDAVLAVMDVRAWTAEKVAEEAGISVGTMTRVTNARSVKPVTVRKVRRALGIQPSMVVVPDVGEGYDLVIGAVCDMIATVMRGLPREELKPTAHRVIKALMQKDDSDNGHT